MALGNGILRARYTAQPIYGGVSMRFSHLFMVGALLAMGATVAKADGVPTDPHFIVDQCAGCDAAAIIASGDAGTVTEEYTTTDVAADFEYFTGGTDTEDLLSLTVTILDAPEGLLYQCVSNVFPDCAIEEPPSDCNGVTCTLTIFYNTAEVPSADGDDELDPTDPIAGSPYGDAILCNNNGHGDSDCPGFIAPGQVVSLLTEVPEPSSLLLLVAGLVPVFGLGRKRWANRSV